MQKYIDTVAVKNGARQLTPLVGGLVTVTTLAGAAAQIFDANGGLPRSSPLLTDINGAFSFYAVDGRYTITITGAGIVPITISDVLLEDQIDGLASLSVDAGSTLVGYGGSTVSVALNSLNQTVADYAALRSYSGPRISAYVTGFLVSSAPAGISGAFARDDADTTSADNGGTIIVAANGKRWKRVFTGAANIQWFGAKGNGVQNDRPLIQAAWNAHDTIYVPGTSLNYYLDDQIQATRHNQVIYGDGPASHLQVINGSVNAIYGLDVNGVTVRNLMVSTKNQTNATAYKGAVVTFNCDFWSIENITAVNMGYWGVGLQDSESCRVTGCRFTSGFGAVQDSANIAMLNNCHFNDIESNYCYNVAAEHGIFMQDTYSNSQPIGNRIRFNFIDGQKSDGISVYTPSAYNSRTLIDGNDIRNIQGTALAGQSGHGIYIQSVGGTRAVNNTIVNCARFTTSFETQVVGGIGVAIGEYVTGVLTAVDVSHNHIVMNRGPCIAAATSAAPVHINHNYTEQAGVEAVRSECIRTVNVRRAHVAHNKCKQMNPNYQSIAMLASDQTIEGGALLDNDIVTVAFGVQVGVIGTGAFSDLNYGGNRINGGNDQGTNITGVTNLRFHNNRIKSTGISAVFSGCPGAQLTGNILESSFGSYSVIFTGTMTGATCNETNRLPVQVQNDGGMAITRRATAPPIAGNIHAVGDRTINSAPAVGQPKAWTCTTAGAGGVSVHTSEGNL